MSEGFFDQYTSDLARDRWQRPLIKQPDGSVLPYTRASSLSDYVASKDHLHRWEMRYLARGLGMSEDLAAMAGGEVYSTGLNVPHSDAENRQSGRNLDSIIERATDRVRIHEKADYGTAVHSYTNPDCDVEPPDRMLPTVRSFRELLERRRILVAGTEVFVVNDDLHVAGTLDHLVDIPGIGWCVGDKKTSPRMSWHEFAVQISIYANSEIYDPATGERTPLESLTEGDEVCRDVGAVFQVRDGKTLVHYIDLEIGYEAAKIASWIRDYHRHKSIATEDVEGTIMDSIRAEQEYVILDISNAETYQELLDIHALHERWWSDELTELARARRKEIET